MSTVHCRDKLFQNIKAVLFDKDGTLADAESFLKSLGHRRSRLVDAKVPGVQEPLLMAFGLAEQLDPAGLLAVGSRRENEIAAAAYIAETGRSWVESLEIARIAFAEADQYLPRKADQTPLFAGGLDLLKSLAAANVKLGILSGDTTEHVQEFVDKYQLESLIHLSMGTDVGPSKPDPRLFQQACAALGVVPAETLMVGDAAADVLMARAAGAAGCVGVTWGWANPPLANADVAIARFEDIWVTE